MNPYANPVTFSATGSVGSREDRTCLWNFIVRRNSTNHCSPFPKFRRKLLIFFNQGTEPCIPLLTCTDFNLLDGEEKCKDYLEVYDGNLGLERFCEKKGPTNISAYGGLRDLFVSYKAFKVESGDQLKFSCTVTCSNRGQSTLSHDYTRMSW